MALETITREEFDTRLTQSTQAVRERSRVLEVQASDLEDLLGQYASVLERLEADTEQSTRRPKQETVLQKISAYQDPV